MSFIISGNERCHRIKRKAVCDHLCANQNESKTYLPSQFHGNVREYLRQTNMRNAGVWATEVEIFTVAHLLKTNVYTYTKHGEHLKWLRHTTNRIES